MTRTTEKSKGGINMDVLMVVLRKLGVEATQEEVDEAIVDALKEVSQKIATVKQVILSAMLVCKVTHEEIMSPKRYRSYIDARMMAYQYLVYTAGMTRVNAGKAMGGRDHTTVINSLNNHAFLVQHDIAYKDKYMRFLDEIQRRVSQ